MKPLRLSILLLALASSLVTVSCTQQKAEKTTDYPIFWTWMDYRPGMNFDSICTVMNEVGIDGVMLNARTPDD